VSKITDIWVDLTFMNTDSEFRALDWLYYPRATIRLLRNLDGCRRHGIVSKYLIGIKAQREPIKTSRKSNPN
jgi:hypothetical protein